MAVIIHSGVFVSGDGDDNESDTDVDRTAIIPCYLIPNTTSDRVPRIRRYKDE